MLDRISLPLLETIKHFEGKGNYAVKKYYTFPFSIFYKHKLKMIVDMFEERKIYRSILDFGAGEPKIFNRELKKHAISVYCVDSKSEIDTRLRYDVIVCASILEFIYLPTTLPVLKTVLNPNGILIAASPMDTWLTKLYYKMIKDTSRRTSEEVILDNLSKYFNVVEYRTWLGLYFCLKATPK